MLRLCFTKLKLLLLAIELKSEDGLDSKISINPRGAKISSNTQGFFIAQSADEVKRLRLYLYIIQVSSFIRFFVLNLEPGSTVKPATKTSKTKPSSRSANAKTVSWSFHWHLNLNFFFFFHFEWYVPTLQLFPLSSD